MDAKQNFYFYISRLNAAIFVDIFNLCEKMRQPNWIDKLVYKLFFWRWTPLFEDDEMWREDVKKKIDWIGEDFPVEETVCSLPDIKEKENEKVSTY